MRTRIIHQSKNISVVLIHMLIVENFILKCNENVGKFKLSLSDAVIVLRLICFSLIVPKALYIIRLLFNVNNILFIKAQKQNLIKNK